MFLVVALGGYYWFVWKQQRPLLLEARAKEGELMQTLETKAGVRRISSAYRAQLAEMEKSFGAMLRQLPNKTEVPNLLVDISQTGLAAGLEEKLFQPQGENKKDFYAELPITIRLTGGYHEMGRFASGIAALPRIVTLHDIEITPPGRDKNAAIDSSQLDAERDRQDVPLPRRGRAGTGSRGQGQESGQKDRQEKGGRSVRHEHGGGSFPMTHMKRVAVAAFALALLAGCSDDMDALRAKVTEIKSAPGRGIEAAAGGEAVRDVRLRFVDPACTVRAGPAGVGQQPERHTTRRQPAARVPRAVFARYAAHGRHRPLEGHSFTAWCRRATASCTACCPATTWARAMAVSRPSRKPAISLTEIVPDGMGGFIERPAALALSE